LAGPGKGNVEHEHRTGFDIHDPGGGLAELHGAFAAEQLVARLVDKPDADRVYPDLRATASDPQHQVGSRVDGGKAADPYMLEDAEDGELALLVDQGVIGDNRKIDLQLRRPESR
jgi:hypothetical protein